MREPEDQFYGDRVYSAMDPQGHVWTFGQAVRHVTREDAEKVSGFKIEGWAWRSSVGRASQTLATPTEVYLSEPRG